MYSSSDPTGILHLAKEKFSFLEDISSANFALYTDGEVKHDVIIVSQIQTGDFDYDSVYNMDKQFRFNYTQQQSKYSKVFVRDNGSGNVTVNSLG